MTTQTPTNAGGSKYVLDKLIAVALVVWLLFFGGFSTLKTILTPTRLKQVADTISTGADRVTRGAPTTRPLATPRTTGNAPPANPPADQSQIQALADAAYRATVQAVSAAEQAPAAPAAQPSALPTAAIVYPTVPPLEKITVVPQDMPVLASNSPPTVTPAPTIAYPTPLPAAVANAYTLSPDGKCLTVERGGKRYQSCQDWPYKEAEARSLADLMRTGLVPGVEVQ